MQSELAYSSTISIIAQLICGVYNYLQIIGGGIEFYKINFMEVFYRLWSRTPLGEGNQGYRRYDVL